MFLRDVFSRSTEIVALLLWFAALNLHARARISLNELRPQKIANPVFVLDRNAPVIAAPEDAAKLRTRLGVNLHFLKDDHALDLARNAGFGFVRMDLSWAGLEKQGKYDFGPFDDLMGALEARGMGVLWLLAYGHPGHGGKLPQSSEDVAAYARYAAAVVSHFRGHNARFEIWNEPNAREFLPNPSIYPELLRAALEAIRHQDPGAAVSTGGISGLDFPFIASMLKSGAAQHASAIAVHPYRDSVPETFLGDLVSLKKLARRTAGLNVPVWATEWGYSSYGNPQNGFTDGGHNDVARKRQAVLVVRECLTAWLLDLPVLVVYDLRDDGSNPLNREDNFGLLNQDNSGKPAMKALKTLSSVAEGRAYSGMIRDVPHNVHAMRLTGTNDIVLVVWNDNARARTNIRFVPDDSPSIRNMFGEPITTDRNELILEETAGPIYVRLKRH